MFKSVCANIFSSRVRQCHSEIVACSFASSSDMQALSLSAWPTGVMESCGLLSHHPMCCSNQNSITSLYTRSGFWQPAKQSPMAFQSMCLCCISVSSLLLLLVKQHDKRLRESKSKRHMILKSRRAWLGKFIEALASSLLSSSDKRAFKLSAWVSKKETEVAKKSWAL